MSFHSIVDVLSLVEKPSRYLGCEINSVRKDPATVDLRIALAFPDLYEIGTSHFGLQILYHILNRQASIAAERVYAPAADMAAYLKSSGLSLCSLETHTPLSAFDIVGFSLLYELNYTNILMMLDLAGIPFRSADRDETHPIVIAGGPCTVNPEPVADFFDAMVVGDGEEVIVEMCRRWLEWKAGGGRERSALLQSWSEITGVYVPSLFTVSYDENGCQQLTPERPGYDRITRSVIADLDGAVFPDTPVVPFGRPVHDRLRLEIARGCTRGCRFCQAGMIYRPVRERSLDRLMELVDRSVSTTGYEDLSLLSLSTGDFGCLVPLLENLMARYGQKRMALSIPSFRAGTLTPEMMTLIRQVRKTGFTIAPEAGSQRLRDVINKNITEQNIIDTVSGAFDLGWRAIKLYFMIGLPTETDADLAAIGDLVRVLRRVKGAGGRRGDITVSVATFIPKAHVPFQWAAQIEPAEARERIERLRHMLRMKGVQFKWQKPETSLLEGLWARGDRRLAPLLETAWQNGCRFDGWTDSFDFSAWQESFSMTGTDVDFYTTRPRSMSEPLPWDHIDCRVSKDFLIGEYDNAINGRLTNDCRWGDCQQCGVCDFEAVMPRVNPEAFSCGKALVEEEAHPDRVPIEQRLEVVFAKRGLARYFGHIEQMNLFIRALRRAAIPVKFSSGFHPKPKIAFADALPIGVESEQETFYMTICGPVDADAVRMSLNRELPEGLRIVDCRITALKSGPKRPPSEDYEVKLSVGGFDAEALQRFFDAPAVEISRKSKSGTIKTIDLKTVIVKINRLSDDHLFLRLKNEPGRLVRPEQVIRSIFGFSDDAAHRARILKLQQTSV